MDILVLRDFAELLDMKRNTFYISYEPVEQTKLIYNSDRYICNAFFAANKNNIFLENILNERSDAVLLLLNDEISFLL